MTDLRIALVSREVYPFDGGGISYYVTSLARVLSAAAEVTILTTAAHESQYRRLCAAADERLPENVRFEFVPPPDAEESGSYYGFFHEYSARVLDALAGLYPDGGPDLVQFSDYHGEAAVCVQARHTLDPRLRGSVVCVNAHTTSEMCQVLDGRRNPDFRYRAMFELERYALRHADHVIWPGGDVLATYRRFFGETGVADPVRIPNAFVPGSAELEPGAAPPSAGPLRLLYMGRMERRKGIYNLLRGLIELERDDWTLTILGGDTETGPLGSSIRGMLELTAAGDERVRFIDAVAREELPRLIDEHHVCAVPSLWECWPNVALEALRRGRPLLSTPTGGMTEIVQPGRSGWLAGGTDHAALAGAVEDLLASREAVDELIEGGGPGQVLGELTDPDMIRERWLELARAPRRRTPRAATGSNGARRPLVSVIVTYFELDEYVEEAVASLCAQTYPELEVLIVNDGSFREEDTVLEGIAARYPVSVVAQPNSGLPQARNLGIALTRGRYVLPFDADDIAEPELVERCVEALEADPDAAYVTPWSNYMLENGKLVVGAGYQPLGNRSALVREQNVAGSAVTLFRREVFDRFEYDPEFPSYEDWYLFRQLHDAGLYGHALPQRLYRYRIRSESMLRSVGDPDNERIVEEMEARALEQQMQWTAPTDAASSASRPGAAAGPRG
jgi:glycosyltransferase involved in cell wall biosynthesis